jgi:hypothetical protein
MKMFFLIRFYPNVSPIKDRILLEFLSQFLNINNKKYK